jgi:transposase
MARKNCTDEFRCRAVDLHGSSSGATLKGIAADLGISRGALKEWVDKLGSGATAAPGSAPSAPAGWPQVGGITRLEAENAVLSAKSRKLTEERDILRQAAKYFAGEANW